MDTPESPTQSPQSPEEEDKGLSDSELLDSADEVEDRAISGLDDEDKEEEAVGSRGKGSEVEEEREEDDEVVPDFVSDPEDEEPVRETGGMGHEDETIMLMEVDEDGPREEQIDGEDEEEDRVIDTPQSPDSEPEQVRRFIAEDNGDDREEGYGYYRIDALAEPETAEEEEDDDESKAENNKRARAEEEERRRAVMVREMDDDSASVSRELDEHELDYDEEVPEEPSIPTHEEEEDEEDAKAEGEEEEESEDKSSKKEKKPILPPSPKVGDSKRTDDGKGSERLRRDSFRDKKDEDDGEIDEGEIDVSDHSF